jgi:hypothetical protein
MLPYAIVCNRKQSYAIVCNQRSSGAARLHEPDLLKRGARSDTKLSLDEVDAGHLLRDSVLNLRASGAR